MGTSLLAAAVVAYLTVEAEINEPDDVRAAREFWDLGVRRIFLNRAGLGDRFWEMMINGAQRRYCILGVASHRYHGTANRREVFSRAFRAAAVKGVEIEVLFLKPDSGLAVQREREEKRATRADIADSIEWFWSLREKLPDDVRHLVSLREYEDTPTCGITWADDTLIVSQYLAGELNLEAPGFVLDSSIDGSISATFMKNYAEIRAHSTAVDADRVNDLVARAPDWRTEGGGRSESEINPPGT